MSKRFCSQFEFDKWFFFERDNKYYTIDKFDNGCIGLRGIRGRDKSGRMMYFGSWYSLDGHWLGEYNDAYIEDTYPTSTWRGSYGRENFETV